MTGRIRAGLGGIAIFSLALCVGGCALGKKETPPLEPPPVRAALGQYSGTALSGPQVLPVADDALKQLWIASARVIAVESLPTQDFQGLASQARLIVATRAGAPITASARMTPGLQFRRVPADFDLDALLGDPRRFSEISKTEGGVAAGTTWDLRLSVDLANQVITAPTRQAISLRLSRGSTADAYDLAVASEDLVPPEGYVVPAELPLGALPPPPPMVQIEQEMLIAPRQLSGEQDRLLLAVPMAFANSRATGIVIDLTIATKPAEPQQEAAAGPLRERVLAASAEASKRIAVTTGSAEELALSSALSALLQAGDDPRGALAYLAGETGAGLTESVVLVADSSLLQLISKSVAEAAPGLKKRDRANVAWLLDRTTVSAVTALAASPTNPVGPAVFGALTAYAGEVGRQLDALNSLVGQSNGPQDLQNRLVAEHQLYLEDNSPAARVRAYDWLNQRSLAPAGFDPLAPARQRRAVLEQGSGSNAATQPVSPSTAPSSVLASSPSAAQPSSTQPSIEP